MRAHPFVPWMCTKIEEEPTGEQVLYGERWIPVVLVTMRHTKTVCARCSWQPNHPYHQ